MCFYTRNLNYLRNLKNDKSSNRETFPTFNFSLKNILSDEEILKVSSNRQIFLIETHMDRDKKLSNARQACTVEAAGEKI
jgi:hypothetical protein